MINCTQIQSKDVFEKVISNKINQSLRSKGIDDKYIKQVLKDKEDKIEPDFVSA